jgi:hypothetical protein
MPFTIPSQVPLVGGQTIGPPDQSQTQAQAAGPTGPSLGDQLAQTLGASHRGVLGPGAPQYVQGTGTQQGSKFPTGFNLYTFNDGSSIEINDQGQSQNYKPSTEATQAANKTLTPQQALAQNGIYDLGTAGIYVKNPTPDDGRGPYVQSTASQQQQQLSDAKTAADTQVQQLNIQKQQIANALTADPTNQQLQQQKLQLDNQVQQANIAKTNADIANQAITTSLNQQKTASDITTQQGNLQVAQGNLGVNQQKTAADIVNQQGTLAISQAKLPGDVAQQQATLQGTQLANQAAQGKLNEPSMLSTGSGPTYTYWDPATQSTQTAQNPAYQPTDPALRTQQIQQQATAQYQALQQQVQSGKLTSDQAASQFDQWWSTNAEPMKTEIAQQQATQQSALAQQQAMTGYYQAQAANLPATLANTASDAAQRNAISMLPYLVNKSAATSPGVISNGPNRYPTVNPQQIMQNATFSVPNLQEIGRMGAAQALANFSPTAQAHLAAGPQPAAPPVAGMPDISSLLNRGAYGFGAPPQPMPFNGAPQPPQSMPMPPSPPPAPQPMPFGAVPPDAMGMAAGQTPAGYGPLNSNNWWGQYQPAA